MFHTVEEGTEVVIYRRGKFHRIDGPGVVVLTPGLDDIHHELDVREHLYDIPITGLLVNGAPVGLKLHFSAHLDIRKCSPDRDKQETLASWDDWQRRQRIEGRTWRAVVQTLAAYEQTHPVSAEADDYTKLKHIIPNPEPNIQLCRDIEQILQEELCDIGFVLDRTGLVRLTLEYPSPPPRPDPKKRRTTPHPSLDSEHRLPPDALLTADEVKLVKTVDDVSRSPQT
jgi:hypothetical protein